MMRNQGSVVVLFVLVISLGFSLLTPGLLTEPAPVRASASAADPRAGPAPNGSTSRPSVALVLGGGSARGFSHIGLLKALAEEGIPVDLLVGTSMGSIIAGLHAAGLSVQNIEHIATEVNFYGLFVPAGASKGGIIAPDRFERFLDRLLDDATFDDVVIPYYSIVTHLQTGREVALSDGPLSRGIVASMSIPGVFPPVEIDGEYYVDGGVASLIPVHMARRLGADVIIAVDVRGESAPLDPHSISSVLELTLDHLLGANADEQLEEADVVVRPQLDSNSYLEYDRAADFIAEGYRAAQEAMPDIKTALLKLDPDFPFGIKPPPAGVPHDEFAMRVAHALESADRNGQWLAMSPPPEVVTTSERAPIIRAGFDVSVGRWQGKPIYGFFSRERSAVGWLNTFGVGTGNCGLICGGVFGRAVDGGGALYPGILIQGEPDDRFRYRLEWEHRREDSPAWRVALTSPPPTRFTGSRGESHLRVMQDPRGLYGPVHEDVRAEALYRYYLPGSTRSVAGLIRQSSSWYVGAGVGASFAEPTTLSPLAEAGIRFEGRLFGILPITSRLAVTYSGGDTPWSLRWTLGE